ncbi:MAG: FapA family protein [Planctomycetota bacterium]
MAADHDLDAHLQLRADEDQLVGTLLIGPRAPAAELSQHVLMVYLDAHGISERLIDRQAVADLCEQFKENPGSEQSAIVARGTPPRHGKPRTLAWSEQIHDRIAAIEARSAADEPSDQQPPPQQHDDDDAPDGDADGQSVDHYEHSAFIIVEASENLGTISPSDPGEDGENIYGEIIPAKRSPDPGYIDTRTIELTDTNQVKARNSGHLLYAGSRRSVERTLEVSSDVGFGTGHVDFPGPVVVSGGVKDRFHIVSAGDTTVRKLVEAAHIRSRRDIRIERGVAGRESATLDSSRDVHAGYLEGTCVTAMRDCIVEREITNCEITVRGSVIIERGAIRGGSITSAKRVEAGVIGSMQEVRTDIQLGSIPELDGPLAQILALRRTAASRQQDLTLKLESIRSAMDTSNPEAIEKTMGLEFEIGQLSERVAQLDAAADRIRENLRSHTAPELVIHKRIHAGVVVRLRGQLVRFKNEIDGPLALRVARDGEPIIEQNGQERPAREIAEVEPDETLDSLAEPVTEASEDDALGEGLISDSGQQAA